MSSKQPKQPKRPTKCKRKKRHCNSVQPPLEEDPDQAQPKRKRSGSEPPGEASTSAEVNLPPRAADEYWTISDDNITSTTTLGEEPPPAPYDPSSEIPSSPVLEKLQIDNMPFESDAYFDRVTLALSPVTVPQLSNYYTEPTADDTLTPRPPVEDEEPKPSTSGIGKTGKPWRTVEEDVQREEKEKYKQLLKLLKDKYAKYCHTPKPTSCNVEIYHKESLSAVTFLEEQKCGGDASKLLTPKTGDSSPRHSPEREEPSYCTPAEKEGKGREERQPSAGRQQGDEVPEDASSELRPAPVLPRPSVHDEEEKKFPKSRERFPPLTEAMEREIKAALGEGKPDEILSSAFKLRLTREDIQTLNNHQWLNDEVINFYMNLLMERGKKENYPSVYAFSTFFYTRLLSEGYRAVKRWTRNVNLFKQHIILVPIHLTSHWTLVVVDIRKKTITYFDSFGKKGDKICQAIFQYLQEESWEKDKVKLSFSEWTLYSMESHEIPQQLNGSDCGVFMCKYADYVCRDKPITFTEKDMPYFRKKMVWEIIHQQLL
ncbi:sentrin-specific protease 2 isoform X2 [Phasianus colchicus]|uniref:sentrin-specific protease 2 isoform X2 n=1 Tax=Phasianus colchicus TaxID=9054 RepID=UPI00129D3EC2|nr:sentrin-specific protease 2 isoform X2 [Phasianus colchicus]